ncbi:hypothetical protein ACH5RR_020089 [Cinchona calisaya]|uniref:DCD domain-containing protein n=1 Tax=Cinchona calisaya TaxID=153742 RepID=A0ABD2ZGW1_9GENT
MAPGKFKKKDDGNIADSAAELVKSDEKNSKSVKAKLISAKSAKAKLKDASKLSSQELVQSKEARTVSEVTVKNKNKRKRNKLDKKDWNGKTDTPKRNKLDKKDWNGKTDTPKDVISHRRNEVEKITKDKREGRERREQKPGKSIGGMIFMCNAKTKPDCFHYHVMGVSAGRLELVMRIKPGLKLFLYDFDLKLMYGIYEATSTGGMKLQPAAFAGAFPAQVRFKIYKDCLPLPEGVFKKAIRDSYDEKTHKFKTELTVDQVKRLTELFHPAPWLHSNARSSQSELMPVPSVQPPPSLSTLPSQETHREQVYREQQYGTKPRQGSTPYDDDGHNIMPKNAHSSDPLFLTEKEYRNYGLRSERHFLPTTASGSLPTSTTYDNHWFDHGREQLPSNLISRSDNSALVPKEPGRGDIHFLSEKEYRTYGLKGCQEPPSRQTLPTLEANRVFEDSMKNVCNPYDDSTTSLVNRYLSLPGTVATPTEPYYLTRGGAYVNNSSYTYGTKDHLGRLNSEGEISHSSYASHALSEYNKTYHRLGGDPGVTSSTVSSRYSFEGPSFSRR